MWYQFFLQNLHFVLNFLAAFALFATTWLYFDSWQSKKRFKETLKIVGFVLLSISFVVSAGHIEAAMAANPILGQELYTVLLLATRLTGYILLIWGLITDPLQPRPNIKEILSSMNAAPAVMLSPLTNPLTLNVLFPISAGIAAFAYFRRATVGLERHLMPMGWAFLLLTVYELVALRAVFTDSTSILLATISAPFSVWWLLEHLILFMFAAVLVQWVWKYLLTRFQSQLFIIFTATTLVIFLITTVIFTGLLIKNIQDETLRRLTTDVKVLKFAIDIQKNATLSDAQVLAQNQELLTSLESEQRSQIAAFVEKMILTKKQSTLAIVSDKGQVLARGEDRERIGDSLADDPLVGRALFGNSVVGITVEKGVFAPVVAVTAAVPIKKDSTIIGAIVVGTQIDNAFVDGVKTATGLEAQIFGGNMVSASTVTDTDSKTRLVGLIEPNVAITQKVLSQGNQYQGSTKLANTDFYGAYVPFSDIDNTPVGMLFVGTPQVSVLTAAGASLELTFLCAILMIVATLYPTYLIARFIVYQVE